MEATVRKVLTHVTGNENLEKLVNAETDLINDLGLDSLQMINLILALEDELGINFDFDEFDYSHLKSFSSFCYFLKKSQGI
ncbi:MAG: acyl carrier protein [Oligoflexales bacterium]|nr:acyl carrier protein [Oligoflexales bacterium]